MAEAKIKCDGCGKDGEMIHTENGLWTVPEHWFVRGDKDGVQVSCSRGCIEIISKKTGKTNIVIPI